MCIRIGILSDFYFSSSLQQFSFSILSYCVPSDILSYMHLEKCIFVYEFPFVLLISGCRIVLLDKHNVSHPIYTRPLVQWQWVEYHRHHYPKWIRLSQKIGVILRWVWCLFSYLTGGYVPCYTHVIVVKGRTLHVCSVILTCTLIYSQWQIVFYCEYKNTNHVVLIAFVYYKSIRRSSRKFVCFRVFFIFET